MKRATLRAGTDIPQKQDSVPFVFEMSTKERKRHYLLAFQEKTGICTLPVIAIPDGTYFLDDHVSNAKIGLFDGTSMRKNGLCLTWTDGSSPLKVIRMIRHPRSRCLHNTLSQR